MKNNMIVNTKMDVMTYIQTVNNLASEYFYSNGEFAPHVGMINAMKMFYDTCVTSDSLATRITDGMDEISIVNVLAADEDFIYEFNRALFADHHCLDFANAYRDAMDIVETRKSSFCSVTDIVKNMLDEIVKKITPALSEENFKALTVIANNIAAGKPTAQSFVEAFSKSQRFKEIVNQNKSTEKSVE